MLCARVSELISNQSRDGPLAVLARCDGMMRMSANHYGDPHAPRLPDVAQRAADHGRSGRACHAGQEAVDEYANDAWR